MRQVKMLCGDELAANNVLLMLLEALDVRTLISPSVLHWVDVLRLLRYSFPPGYRVQCNQKSGQKGSHSMMGNDELKTRACA
jgi:hypothetical protein